MGHSARIVANSLTWANGSIRRTRSASRCGRSILRNTRTCPRESSWTARRQKRNEERVSAAQGRFVLEQLGGQRLTLINPCSCFPRWIVHTLAIAYEPPQVFPALDSVRFAVLFLFVPQLRSRRAEKNRAYRRLDYRPSEGGARI